MRFTSLHARLGAGLLGVGLLAAACGGDDTDTAAEGSSTTAAAAQTTEGATPTTEAAAETTVTTAKTQTTEAAAPATKDIVDTAVGAGNFKTLATALTAAGLVDTLKGPGPFTVFAPTDAAFAALPAGTVDTLLANKDELTKVLTYHVVSGSVTADKVVTLKSANTVQGSPVSIEVKDGTVILNGKVKVTTTDIKASNGVIHVIDGVLLPS